MFVERRYTGLEEALENIEKYKFINIENLFKEIQTPADGENIINKLRQTTSAINSLLDMFIIYKLSSLNKRKLSSSKYSRKDQKNHKVLPGDRLWRNCKRLMSSRYNYITLKEAVLLLEVAYERAIKHFDNSGYYLKEHIGRDAKITRLPVRYAQFKKNIKPPNRRKKLSKSQLERLNVFLNYWGKADLDSDLKDLKPIYLKFEEAMFFCSQVPEKYKDIPAVKRNNFEGSWRKYKLSEENKKSVYYNLINEFQQIEKEHPNIEAAMIVFLQHEKTISKTSPLGFKD